MWYEDALSASHEASPAPAQPDDLYILYTGGTTGMPKGVMWRQGDALTECFGASREATTIADLLAATPGRRALIAPPFMHGAGHWVALGTWNAGGTVFIPSIPERLDAHDMWSTVEREKIDFLLIVGDAFARPLIDQLRIADYDLSSLTVLLSGGAILSVHLKEELLQLLPQVMIIDGLGSSEAGGQLTHASGHGVATTGRFPLSPHNHVLDADFTRLLSPGHSETDHPDLGWLAKSGRLALGYLGDADKTARTYRTIDGVRYVIPGDRAILASDGFIELRGRDSATINSGGEKYLLKKSRWQSKPTLPLLTALSPVGQARDGAKKLSLSYRFARIQWSAKLNCSPRPLNTSRAISCLKPLCFTIQLLDHHPEKPTIAGRNRSLPQKTRAVNRQSRYASCHGQ